MAALHQYGPYLTAAIEGQDDEPDPAQCLSSTLTHFAIMDIYMDSELIENFYYVQKSDPTDSTYSIDRFIAIKNSAAVSMGNTP